MESLTFFGVSVEYFGVFKGLLDLLVLISFRSYGGILTIHWSDPAPHTCSDALAEAEGRWE